MNGAALDEYPYSIEQHPLRQEEHVTTRIKASGDCNGRDEV